jgi:hypothetical protein
MSIEVICPTCDQVHRVKDESAGKKLRCKGCQAVIPIPAASETEEADPWDTGDIEEPAPRQAPRQRKKSIAKPERARTRSSDGMPITIMVSLGICGLFIAIVLVTTVLNLIAGEKAQAGGTVVRLLIDITIIKGLLARSNRIRWNAIILDGVGLAFGFSCIAGAVFLASNPQFQQHVPAGGATLLIAIFAVQSVFWIVDLIMLLSPSARDYCNA